MKNSKGITMASLIVMIASIILLATMAIGFGYRYIKETNEADETYFKEVLSSAVSKRENNHTVNSIENPRIGYSINTLDGFNKIVENYVPELKSYNKEMLYERGLWYIVDTYTAQRLGVKESENYIDIFDESNTKKMTVALVDYYSGAVYLFDINGIEIGSISGDISGDSIIPEDGHVHDFNLIEATCTEDKKCLICGYVEEVARGHKYEGGEIGYTPIDDEFHYTKECIVCHMQGGYERHVGLDTYTFKLGDDGTWYHYNGCSLCGWPGSSIVYEECDIIWKSISDTEHVKQCRICKHEEAFPHEFKYVYIDENYHELVCTICGYAKINFEPHEDEDDNGICDKCDGEIIKSENPVLLSVNIKNKEYPNSNYATDRETIQLTFTADKYMSEAKVTICGYGGDNIRYKYSADKLTCTAELFIDSNIVIAQNTEITFTIDCKSSTTGSWMSSEMRDTTDGSYLIYDSLPPTMEYINKETY